MIPARPIAPTKIQRHERPRRFAACMAGGPSGSRARPGCMAGGGTEPGGAVATQGCGGASRCGAVIAAGTGGGQCSGGAGSSDSSIAGAAISEGVGSSASAGVTEGALVSLLSDRSLVQRSAERRRSSDSDESNSDEGETEKYDQADGSVDAPCRVALDSGAASNSWTVGPPGVSSKGGAASASRASRINSCEVSSGLSFGMRTDPSVAPSWRSRLLLSP